MGAVSPKALNKFISANISKLSETGDCVKHRGGNGRPKIATNRKVTLQVKKRMVKNPGTSLRKVAKAVGVGTESVRRILRTNLGVKPYLKCRVQKMKKEHKIKRVEFAQYCLKEYG